jgi:hypothetical protein
MKKRIGFVSNSSSSSFICGVCGEEFSGMDVGLSDANMIECVNKHTVCKEHLKDLTTEDKKKYLLVSDQDREYKNKITLMKSDDEIEEAWDEYMYDGGEYEYPDELCPICQFEIVDVKDTLEYLLKKYKLTDESILKELKNEFGSYKEFKKHIGKK